MLMLTDKEIVTNCSFNMTLLIHDITHGFHVKYSPGDLQTAVKTEHREFFNLFPGF